MFGLLFVFVGGKRPVALALCLLVHLLLVLSDHRLQVLKLLHIFSLVFLVISFLSHFFLDLGLTIYFLIVFDFLCLFLLAIFVSLLIVIRVELFSIDSEPVQVLKLRHLLQDKVDLLLFR